MPIEQQVCSPELAKRLNELGEHQESYFYWVSWGGDSFDLMDRTAMINELNHDEEKYSAFTDAELGESLKAFGASTEYILDPEYEAYYCYVDGMAPTADQTEANARAKMRVAILEKSKICLLKT